MTMTEKSFKNYFSRDGKGDLNESPNAKNGDWEYDSSEYLQSTSELVTERYWKFLRKIKVNNIDYELRKLNSEFIFKVGIFDNDKLFDNEYRFITKFRLEMSEYHSGLRFGIEKVLNVMSVATIKDLSGSGLALQVYKYIVNDLGYSIISDKDQYFGARKLWSKLSRETDVVVDVVDLKTFEIIATGVNIKHGKMNDEFDERFWSTTTNKENIRFVLRKIK